MLETTVNPQDMPGAVARPTAASLVPVGALRRLGRQRWVVVIRSFVLFGLLWWVAAVWNANPLQLPTPASVGAAFVELAKDGEIFDHALISTTRLLIALSVSMALAIPLGFWMGRNRQAEAYIDPLVEMLRPISGIAWLPLALFIFGVGDTLPVFIMVYVGFFPILLNTVAGVRQVDPKLIAAANTMGVNRRAVLTQVLVPSALPSVIVGVRLAFAGSWAAIVAAELIGSPSGLGFAIEWYRQMLMTPKVFAFILMIGVVGYLCDLALRKLQRVLTPWSEGTELQ